MNFEAYQAARTNAAFVDEPNRARLVVVGGDRASYLQGLLTNDIQALQPGTGCYAAYLTAQGRMISDMYVLELGDAILIDAPASTGAELLAKFDQFVFSEDVQFGDATATFRQWSVIGPRSADALAAVWPGDSAAGAIHSFAEHQNARLPFEGDRVIVAGRDDYGVGGYAVYVPVERADAFEVALERAGVVRADREVAHVLRVEAGRPLFGADMTTDTIPLEAGIEDRAISFSKGCYVGQEVIIRVLHRGHGRVARKLVGLRVDGSVPAPGAPIAGGDRDVGHVTSAATSPAAGAIALGYVQRDYIAPGTPLSIEGANAHVVTLPFAPGDR